MRTLTINGTDITTLGATLLTVDYGYSKVTTYKDWLRNAKNPLFYGQDVTYTTAQFKILVEAETRGDLDLASSNLVALAQHGKFQVTDADFYINGDLTDAEDSPISSKAKEVTITIEGIKSKDDVIIDVIPLAEVLSVTPVGNVEAAVKFDILPNVSMPNYTLTVNGKEYTITQTATPPDYDGVYRCVIDGINGKVEVGGNNAIDRYQSFEFPTLVCGRPNTLEFTGGASIRIYYTGRWM